MGGAASGAGAGAHSSAENPYLRELLLPGLQHLALADERDDAVYFSRIAAAAAGGHTLSQYTEGICHEFGFGTDIDECLAAESYERAADYAPALYRLGCVYLDCITFGTKLERMATAAEYYRAAAAKGHVESQLELAVFYGGLELSLTAVNTKLAFDYAVSASKAGSVPAQCHLGSFYMGWPSGAVAVDLSKAFYFYSCAKDAGFLFGHFAVGVCYEYGYHVAVDMGVALEHYHYAAARGHARSLCKLGECYEDGIGVVADALLSKTFYRRAAEGGNKGALQKLGAGFDLDEVAVAAAEKVRLAHLASFGADVVSRYAALQRYMTE